MKFFKKFSNAKDIEMFSENKDNTLPLTKPQKVWCGNIYRAIRENKCYNGLYFKLIKKHNEL